MSRILLTEGGVPYDDQTWLQALQSAPMRVVPAILDQFHQFDTLPDVHQRFMFADDLNIFLQTSATTSQRAECIDNDLPNVLFKILLDPTSYISYGNVLPAEQYIGSIVSALTVFADDLSSFYRSMFIPCIRDVMNKLPELWSALWSRRDFFWDPERRFLVFMDERRDAIPLDHLVMGMISKYSPLERWFRGQTRKNEHDAYLALYGWLNGKNASVAKEVLNEAIRLIDQGPSGETLFQEVVLDTNCFSPFREALKTALKDETVVDMPLFEVFGMFGLGAMHYAPLTRERPEPDNEDSFLEVISHACQRQLCCGNPDFERDILMCAFMYVGMMLEAPEHRNVIVASSKFVDLELLSMVAHVYPRALVNNDTSHMRMNMVGSIMSTYSGIGGSLMRRAPNVTYTRVLLGAVRRVWLPTLRKLRALRISPSSPEHQWIREWLIFGEQLGFKESTEPPLYDSYMARLVPAYPYHKHCHRKDCLCHRAKPGHSLRVCKGCWRVLYCSRRCQQRDWQNHKLRCRRIQEGSQN
ncbi:unnamed protein product [Somion occarium]|uniref:MYND-type domain-containing protein n=1 Tax=Somion occarium TaxID=3059160 RepID=A0ABP1DVF7_9APHY